MNSQTAVPLTLLLFVAMSCQSGERTTALRPVAQTSPSASQPVAAPAPTVAVSTPSEAASPAGVRTLVAPGARGEITRSTDENDNLVLEVELKYLPPPGDLDPSLTTYVVWIRPRSGGAFQNVGQLMMGSDREGVLTATTAHGDVDVLVTAEAGATPAQPSRFTVLQGTASKG